MISGINPVIFNHNLNNVFDKLGLWKVAARAPPLKRSNLELIGTFSPNGVKKDQTMGKELEVSYPGELEVLDF